MSNNVQIRDSRNLDFHAIYADFLASQAKSKREYYDKHFDAYLRTLDLAEDFRRPCFETLLVKFRAIQNQQLAQSSYGDIPDHQSVLTDSRPQSTPDSVKFKQISTDDPQISSLITIVKSLINTISNQNQSESYPKAKTTHDEVDPLVDILSISPGDNVLKNLPNDFEVQDDEREITSSSNELKGHNVSITVEGNKLNFSLAASDPVMAISDICRVLLHLKLITTKNDS